MINRHTSLRLALLASVALAASGRINAESEVDTREHVRQLLYESIETSARSQQAFAEAIEWQGISLLHTPFQDQSEVDKFVDSLVYDPAPRFIATTGFRWTTTATNVSVGVRSPFTLTYSFVPDGTVISALPVTGSVAGASNLITAMNSAFGAELTWKNLVRDCFTKVSAITAITFTEVTDNAGNLPATAGNNTAGVIRGDIRIAMRPVDGAGNLLGHAYVPPQGGDIVLDANDSGFFGGDSSNNHRRFRNAFTRQLLYALALSSVNPVDNTKLMEPTLTTTIDGMQEDDVRGIQHMYGDKYERNETFGTASSLGNLVGTPPPAEVSYVDNPGGNDNLSVEDRLALADFFYSGDWDAEDAGGSEGYYDPRAIYGSDDRKDWFEETDTTRLALAKSVCLVTLRTSLNQGSDSRWTLSTSPWTTALVGGVPTNLCAPERFRSQPVGGFCTAFLVSPDLVVTAGHCIASVSEAQNCAFVFNYAIPTGSGVATTKFNQDEVYFGSNLVGRAQVPNGADWALIKLDRPVSAAGATPLAVQR